MAASSDKNSHDTRIMLMFGYLGLIVLLLTAQAHASKSATLALGDGERVLFIGNGFVENDQLNAYFETRLQRRVPNHTITFRYMGWSGDTVRAGARTAGFQVPQGMARLEKEAIAQKPTIIFLCYGMNESFDGPKGLDEFLRDYDKLLKALAPLKARIVIVGPTYHEDLGRPFPEPGEHNQHLKQYTEALSTFAKERKVPFVDLFHPLEAAKKADAKGVLTTNGILLTKEGYALAARAAEEQVGFEPVRWEATFVKGGKLRFEAKNLMLPIAGDKLLIRIADVPAGDVTLKIDAKEIARASAADWARGVAIDKGPIFDDAEKLREAIVLRNQLFYRRWRPYNDHSRHWGFIGGDFKLYDKEIAEQEERIAELRRPRERIVELVK